MKKFIYFIYLSIPLILLSFTSCQKEDLSVSPSPILESINSEIETRGQGKKSSLNTESGNYECLGKGGDCKESATPHNNDLLEPSNLQPLVEDAYPGLNLYNAIVDGEFSAYVDRNAIVIDPVSEDNQKYYIILND